jgi:hypothetical protein
LEAVGVARSKRRALADRRGIRCGGAAAIGLGIEPGRIGARRTGNAVKDVMIRRADAPKRVAAALEALAAR